ncbi:MAG: J domain-containing protein [Bacteroidota bacterium]|uniref:DnaJ-class molecular chaperone CbpA n=1 Tax=Christiangramia flava JLT2011 TaxID=1229726 RepID=A0A1L7I4B8_9FLAO|nr:J domain-containing protein [Christiangramia flava]APU67955.1 DnaJ-class molecular chaperone CbpA [Christiangramia flava JLT2011]MEE2771766.1 J domain-containing protein [Bacteroidota bacterium]OSS40456.1 DnaJ-class molecular chaperone CbpA [Christiangramia flava JLT2011]
MEFIDYYKLLELDQSATAKDIKKAYRKLARKYHPDLNPNDKEAQARFQQINEAHEVLSDPEKRKKYDQYGKDWQHAEQFEQAKRQQSAAGGSGFGGGFGGGQQYAYSGNFDDDTFSDFFEQMFGGRARAHGSGRGGHYKGQDFNAELQLRLSDIYESQKQTLTVNGKNIRLTIPAGVEDGQTIKIKGHGGPGIQGGPKGDLYITFNILNDTSFKREKEHLYAEKQISLSTAVLGGEIEVETFTGKVRLKVKPGTQNGAKVKLKGKGFPKYKKEGFGDLFVTYKVNMPEKLTAEQKELFEKLQKSGL